MSYYTENIHPPKVTRFDFDNFVALQNMGVINMNDTRGVSQILDMPIEVVRNIRNNYTIYHAMFVEIKDTKFLLDNSSFITKLKP